MKDHVESKLQAVNIDATKADWGFKVCTLHKHFLTWFGGHGK